MAHQTRYPHRLRPASADVPAKRSRPAMIRPPRNFVMPEPAIESTTYCTDDFGGGYSSGLVYYLRQPDGTIRITRNVLEWAQWFESAERTVKRAEFHSEKYGDVMVSTVFLGLDHGFNPHERPVLYETMVFTDGSSRGEYQRRACTEAESLEHFAEALNLVLTESLEVAPDEPPEKSLRGRIT